MGGGEHPINLLDERVPMEHARRRRVTWPPDPTFVKPNIRRPQQPLTEERVCGEFQRSLRDELLNGEVLSTARERHPGWVIITTECARHSYKPPAPEIVPGPCARL